MLAAIAIRTNPFFRTTPVPVITLWGESFVQTHLSVTGPLTTFKQIIWHTMPLLTVVTATTQIRLMMGTQIRIQWPDGQLYGAATPA